MQQQPNKLSQFWQELIRRKVIKVIAMKADTYSDTYLAQAFININNSVK